MSNVLTVAVAANFLVIAGLIWGGLALFAEYQARGRWAKNVTGLLGGLGMLVLAAALSLTPQNAQVLVRIAQTRIALVLVWTSTGLLLAAVAAFGILTYSKPLRLLYERRIAREQNRDLPRVP